MRRSVISAGFALVALAHGAVAEEARWRPPPDDDLAVVSATFTDAAFLTGAPPYARETPLTGRLRLPNRAPRLPAVILLHGSDGVESGAVAAWRRALERQGIATLRLDSFGGRGIGALETDQSGLGLLTQIYDAYRAVEVLAADPRIDPDRIALMGFSRGGTAALYAAMRRFHAMYGPARGRIVAYIPVYPACGVELARDAEVVAAPIRIFHGDDDDWVPAAWCRAYAARLRAAGGDVVFTEYPGVRHAFDNPQAYPGAALPRAQTARNCRRAEIDGEIVNLDTGRPFSFADACVEFGPSVGYDGIAARYTEGRVADILAEAFRR